MNLPKIGGSVFGQALLPISLLLIIACIDLPTQQTDNFYIHSVTDTAGVVTYKTTYPSDSVKVMLWSYLQLTRPNEFLGYDVPPDYLGNNLYRYEIPINDYLTDIELTAYYRNDTAVLNIVVLRIARPIPKHKTDN